MSRRTTLALLFVLVPSALALAASMPLLNGLATAATLPDNRTYEMVTPPENDDGEVYAPLEIGQELLNPGEGDTLTRLPFQVSTDGDAVTYVGDATTGGFGITGSGLGNQYLATRAGSGSWRENGLLTQVVLQPAADKWAYYEAFSNDLSVGILQQGELGNELSPLSAEVPSGQYPDLYTHDTEEGSGGVYYPLFTSEPPNRKGEEFGTFDAPLTDQGLAALLVYAGSGGFGESLFEANDALVSGAMDGGETENNLYESVAGRLSLINVLPDGKSEANATFGAPAEEVPKGNPADFSHVISENGSRVFWTDLAPGTSENRIFLRENPTQPESPLGPNDECLVPADACTVPVSAGPARYWTSAEDGRYAFYTEGEGEESELYRFDVEGGMREALTAPNADVEGVIGASEDGEYVYFVARGVLAGNKNSEGDSAALGGNNMYVWREGQAPRFIATLSERDDHETVEPATNEFDEVIPRIDHQPPRREAFGDWQPGLGRRTAEVTPDGRSVVFMSSGQDVGGVSPEVEGVKLEEVYVYSFEEDRLFCASCSRDGVAPEDTFIGRLGGGGFLPPSWSSTYIPPWISENGGRVLFDSLQPLVPEDTNGKPDVYEWEKDGTGSCTESSGCVYLLSEGTSSSASWLVGESSTGNDAFIVSRAHLSPEDQDEMYTLFDARVDGIEPVTPPACTGTGCQGVPATAPTFATPSSATFEGVGNFPPPVEAAPAAQPKAKSLTRAQKLDKALKACEREKKDKRAACERSAHRRFGASVHKK